MINHKQLVFGFVILSANILLGMDLDVEGSAAEPISIGGSAAICPTVIVLNGTSCSGKSQTLRALYSLGFPVLKKVTMDSFDARYLKQIGKLKDSELEELLPEQRATCLAAIKEASIGSLVVCDVVLPSNSQIDAFSEKLRKAGIAVYILLLTCQLPELVRRAESRPDHRRVFDLLTQVCTCYEPKESASSGEGVPLTPKSSGFSTPVTVGVSPNLLRSATNSPQFGTSDEKCKNDFYNRCTSYLSCGACRGDQVQELVPRYKKYDFVLDSTQLSPGGCAVAIIDFLETKKIVGLGVFSKDIDPVGEGGVTALEGESTGESSEGESTGESSEGDEASSDSELCRLRKPQARRGTACAQNSDGEDLVVFAERK